MENGISCKSLQVETILIGSDEMSRASKYRKISWRQVIVEFEKLLNRVCYLRV